MSGPKTRDRFLAFGRIEDVQGASVIARGPKAAIGDLCHLRLPSGTDVPAEVVGFHTGGRIVLTPYGDVRGLAPGLLVLHGRGRPTVPVGDGILGRALGALGDPIDGRPLGPVSRCEVGGRSIRPLERRPVEEPIWTGLRVIDGLLTIGRGQRVGIFAGPGLGKTTLFRRLAAGIDADVMVVALVGERGREVAEFHQALGRSRTRTVLVAATSDMPAILRLRVMETAMTIAEFFRDRGRDVALFVDSLTRVARAASEVGMEAGEFAAVRGYTPSVFALLPRLLERAGRVGSGSITGIYTVLLETDDLDDPIADAVRGILDGHVILSRELAERGHFPAIDVSRSLSRVMPAIVSPTHRELAREVRELWSRLDRARDLLSLGAYRPGNDVKLDRAVGLETNLSEWLRQDGEWISIEETLTTLARLLEEA